MSPAAPSASSLRKQGLAARRDLSDCYRARASASVCRQLIRSRQFARAERVAVYFASNDEVNVDAVMRVAWQAGKSVFAPKILRNGGMFFSELKPDSSLGRNRFGIWEALGNEYCPPDQLDCVLVPLVVFDGALHRIGMGGGYYDRAFAFLKNRHRTSIPYLTGVAFACQRTEKICANPWDIGVSRVVTENASAFF